MAHSAKVGVKVEARESDVVEVGARAIASEGEYRHSFADGVGVGECDKSGSLAETIEAAATPEEVCLHGDSSGDHDLLGLAGIVGFAKVRVIYVENTHATAVLTLNDGSLTPWTSCPFADGSTIQPGGFLLAACKFGAAGWAVAAGDRTLKITSSADGGTFKMVVAGVSV